MLQRLVEVPDQVLGVLDADGQPDQVLRHATQHLVLRREAGVGHGGGMLCERLGGAERHRELHHLEMVEERKGFLFAAVEMQRDQRAGPGMLLSEDGVLGIAGGQEPEVADLAHLGMLREELGDPLGVALLLLGADLQGLKRAREQPGGVGIRHAAEHGAVLGDRLQEGVVIRERDAADDVGMTADEFRGRVEYNVRADLRRVGKDRTGHGVVDDHEHAAGGGVAGRQGLQCTDVGQPVVRVGRALDEDRAGARREQRRDERRGVGPGRHEVRGDPEPFQEMVDQRVRAAVHRRADDHLVTGLVGGEERGGDGRHAARETVGVLHPLPRRDPVLEDLEVGVVDARVDEAHLAPRRRVALAVRPREEALSVLRALEREGRGEEHRGLDRSLAEPGVEAVIERQGLGVEPGSLRIGKFGHGVTLVDSDLGEKTGACRHPRGDRAQALTGLFAGSAAANGRRGHRGHGGCTETTEPVRGSGDRACPEGPDSVDSVLPR